MFASTRFQWKLSAATGERWVHHHHLALDLHHSLHDDDCLDDDAHFHHSGDVVHDLCTSNMGSCEEHHS